jgi:hypothetical protein
VGGGEKPLKGFDPRGAWYTSINGGVTEKARQRLLLDAEYAAASARRDSSGRAAKSQN